MAIYIVAAILIIIMILLLLGLGKLDHDLPIYHVLQWIPVLFVVGSVIFFAICVISVR